MTSRCECTLAPHQPVRNSPWSGSQYREGCPHPLTGKGRCSRRATTTRCGLFVCEQHARYLDRPLARAKEGR